MRSIQPKINTPDIINTTVSLTILSTFLLFETPLKENMYNIHYNG